MGKRKPWKYMVEIPALGGGYNSAINGATFGTQAEAKKAIKTLGESGDYRIVAVVWEGRLAVQQVNKATIVEA